MNYSNPRKKAIIQDYPIGSGARGTAIYSVEVVERAGKERAVRETEKRNGTWAKPKKRTYADSVLIVDGDDGRTYILELSRMYGMINVMKSNMMHSQETIHEKEERYAKLLALFS